MLHVVDISDAYKSEQILEVDRILKEIHAHKIPQILILNQIDKISLDADYDRDEYGRINRIELSAISGNGIEFLRQAIVEFSQMLINQRNGNYAKFSREDFFKKAS